MQTQRQPRLRPLKLPSLRTQSDRTVKPKAVIPREICLDVAEASAGDIATLARMKKYEQKKAQHYISQADGSATYMINEYSLPNALVPYRAPKKHRHRRGGSFGYLDEALLQSSIYWPDKLSY